MFEDRQLVLTCGIKGRRSSENWSNIKKAKGIEAENDELQKFLSIYRITPNVNASKSKAPAELI